MKLILVLSATLLSAGCTIGTHRVAPTALAAGASTGMWTSRPTDEVRACVDRVLAATPSRYRYEVSASDPRETAMTTTVSGFTEGNEDPVGTRITATCLSAG